MLDERPPDELPARASAMAGAKARVALKNSASRMRQFSGAVSTSFSLSKFPGIGSSAKI